MSAGYRVNSSTVQANLLNPLLSIVNRLTLTPDQELAGSDSYWPAMVRNRPVVRCTWSQIDRFSGGPGLKLVVHPAHLVRNSPCCLHGGSYWFRLDRFGTRAGIGTPARPSGSSPRQVYRSSATEPWVWSTVIGPYNSTSLWNSASS